MRMGELGEGKSEMVVVREQDANCALQAAAVARGELDFFRRIRAAANKEAVDESGSERRRFCAEDVSKSGRFPYAGGKGSEAPR